MKENRKALLLSYFTVGYNVIEGIVSIAISFLTGSTALLGFGLDSFVESLSGSIMIWRFGKHGNLSDKEAEQVEKKAMKLIAYTFFILGIYVLYESASALYYMEESLPSLAGIIIALLSVIIMPVLTIMKYKTGKKIGSKSLVADSKQTLMCTLMSFSLLIGLLLNYFYQIWWIDPIVGILIAGMLLREGYYTYKEGKACCC